MLEVVSKSYSIEKLEKHHKMQNFSCGFADLDTFLKRYSGQARRNHTAVTYVLTSAENSILGFYTLSAMTIELQDLPQIFIKKLPRYSLVPATLIGRLAVDQHHQGKGFGEILLLDALSKSLYMSKEIASCAVMVEAVSDEAKSFYAKYRFMSLSENNAKLYLPMKTISQLLD